VDFELNSHDISSDQICFLDASCCFQLVMVAMLGFQVQRKLQGHLLRLGTICTVWKTNANIFDVENFLWPRLEQRQNFPCD